MESFSFKGLAESENSISYGGLYQQIIAELIRRVYSKQRFADFGKQLAALADHLYTMRRMTEIEQISRLFFDLPLPRKDQIIGHHYQALCCLHKGQLAEARAMLERVAEDGPPEFRARAMLSLSATFYVKNDFESVVRYCLEAGRLATARGVYEPRTILGAQRTIAVVRSFAGDHHGALANLERLFPLARAIGRQHPDLFYDYMNSLAVEMAEVGRLAEARRAVETALASPYAPVHPEWPETRDEIAAKARQSSRSLVAVSNKSSPAENILRLPVEPDNPLVTAPGIAREPARVVNFRDWRYRLAGASSSPVVEKPPEDTISNREMRLQMMELIADRDLTQDQLARMLQALNVIAAEPKGKTS